LLLSVAVAFWFLLSAFSIVSSYHEVQAHAPVNILATRLHEPTGLAFDPMTGNLFITEADTGVILRLDPQGALHTYVTGFKHPRGLARDPRDGSLLVVDEKAGSLSRIAQDGSINPLRYDLKAPHWVAVAEDGAIYVTAEEGAGFKLPKHEEGVLLQFTPDGTDPQLLAKGQDPRACQQRLHNRSLGHLT
jgi:sugar lactone lactonase YvrE